MGRKKTRVQLTHLAYTQQYGGGQTGTITHTSSDYASDSVAIVPSQEPILLSCQCGSRFMFDMFTPQKLRSLRWKSFWQKLAIFLAADVYTGGVKLAFSGQHATPLQIIGLALFILHMCITVGAFFYLLFAWPKPYSLEPASDKSERYTAIGSLRIHHDVKLS